MSYTKHEFKSGERLYASQLNEMDDQIKANEQALENKQPKGEYLTETAANNKYQPKGTYATEEFVTQKIAEAELGGGEGGNASGGISNTAKDLLISILRSAVYSTNQSDAISALRDALDSFDDSEPEEPEVDDHVHSYTTEVTVAPTCTEPGLETHTCSCGHIYTTEVSAGHNYVDGVCANCGHSTIEPESEVLELVPAASYPDPVTFEYTEQASPLMYLTAKQGKIKGGTVHVEFDNTVYDSFNINFYVFDSDGKPYLVADASKTGSAGSNYGKEGWKFSGWEDAGVVSGFGVAYGSFDLDIPEGCTFIASIRRFNSNTVYPEGGNTNAAFASWAFNGGVTFTVTKRKE